MKNITIEQARRLLPKELQNIADKEIKDIIDSMYTHAEYIANYLIMNPEIIEKVRNHE